MRKHDVRKWLHAILDLLPVILIPVFMIYSHRHTIDSGSIEVPQNQVVDFNQKIVNGNFVDTSSWLARYNVDFTTNDNVATLIPSQQYSSIFYESINYFSNHINLVVFNYSASLNYTGWVLQSYSSSQSVWFIPNQVLNQNNAYFTYRFTSNIDGSAPITFQFNGTSNYNLSKLLLEDVMFFDLTQMFGSGNEPSNDDFLSYYSDNYYAYTLSHKELFNLGNITYNDTDIMSQFTYQLYNSVDKYFNMGNVFNLNGVYDWFNLNIFNGQAPIYIFIVWQIVLYEFVMDLMFLLYGLFMWFIDMVEKLMEKPINSVR